MPKFDLDNLNPGVRFPFDDETGWVEIRLLSAASNKVIDKACSKKKTEYRRGQRYTWFDVDEEKKEAMTWDEVITSWKLPGANGKDIPCTAENKLKLMTESTWFANFVSEAIERLSQDEAAVKEEQEKN